MTLHDLGWSPFFEEQFARFDRTLYGPARVVEEQKGLYRVLDESGERPATVAGSLRYESHVLPAVGDWVALRDGCVIGSVLERRTKFSRQAAGNRTAEQVIAANVDTIFVVSSLNRDLNPARIERYLTTLWESGAMPVVLLSKADLCGDPTGTIEEMEMAAPGVPVHAVSAFSLAGTDALRPYLGPGLTVALVGSSGVGKSTLINRLVGQDVQTVRAIRADDDRGRHATTARRLIPLPTGGLLVDTPGMRELQLWDGAEGIERAFPEIESLAEECRFRDCRHKTEPGCAVLRALDEGELDERRMESFRKLERELRYAEIRQDAALRSAQNKKWRKIHKEAARFDKRK